MSQSLAVIEEPPSRALALQQAAAEAAADYQIASKSPATLRAYASDWRSFTPWCLAHELPSLPCSVPTLCSYIAAKAAEGLRPSSLSRHVAAIVYAHRLRDLPAPQGERLRATLSGVRRVHGTARRQATPATAELVLAMLAHCPDTLAGKRDRALLALGFAAALRRSELVALRAEDLNEGEAGFALTIARSKTDQTGEGTTIAVPCGTRIRPVEAVRAWLQAAGIKSSFIFRPVLRGSRVQAVALSDHSAATIIKQSAARAGLDPARFSGHSLRSGFITSAAENDVSIAKIAEVSRHASADVLLGYVRRANLFSNHAGTAFL